MTNSVHEDVEVEKARYQDVLSRGMNLLATPEIKGDPFERGFIQAQMKKAEHRLDKAISAASD